MHSSVHVGVVSSLIHRGRHTVPVICSCADSVCLGARTKEHYKRFRSRGMTCEAGVGVCSSVMCMDIYMLVQQMLDPGGVVHSRSDHQDEMRPAGYLVPR